MELKLSKEKGAPKHLLCLSVNAWILPTVASVAPCWRFFVNRILTVKMGNIQNRESTVIAPISKQ